jgi:hypothetical protein
MSSRLRHIVLVLCFVSGCSVYMEATRPTPVDLAKFQPGESRSSVTQELGLPVTTSKGATGTSCDLYLLYTRGYGVAGKAPIAVGELAADVFTIGLAEIVLSPTEAVTRNEKRTVWFCYQNDALVSVTVKSAAAETSTPVPSESSTPTDLATPVRSNPATATPTATPSIGGQSR